MKAIVFHEFSGVDASAGGVPDPAGAGSGCDRHHRQRTEYLDVDVREGVSRFPVNFPSSSASRVGRIRELGDGVSWQVGDRVMSNLMDTCGTAGSAHTGRKSLCLTPGFISFSTSGGYAEQLACAVGHLLRIPDELSDEAASLQITFKAPRSTCSSRGPARAGETVSSTRWAAGSAPQQSSSPTASDRARQRKLRRSGRPSWG